MKFLVTLAALITCVSAAPSFHIREIQNACDDSQVGDTCDNPGTSTCCGPQKMNICGISGTIFGGSCIDGYVCVPGNDFDPCQPLV